jgi:hypothetical protein
MHLLSLENAHEPVTVPVVAAINGHCFAGGFGLALASDYRVMVDGAARNAWMCMNEIHFGSSWPRAFAALFRAKAPDVRAHRLVALEGARITPPQARELGLVDVVHGTRTEEVLERAVQLARERAPEARAGAYGLIKVHARWRGCECLLNKTRRRICTGTCWMLACWTTGLSCRTSTMRGRGRGSERPLACLLHVRIKKMITSANAACASLCRIHALRQAKNGVPSSLGDLAPLPRLHSDRTGSTMIEDQGVGWI